MFQHILAMSEERREVDSIILLRSHLPHTENGSRLAIIYARGIYGGIWFVQVCALNVLDFQNKNFVFKINFH